MKLKIRLKFLVLLFMDSLIVSSMVQAQMEIQWTKTIRDCKTDYGYSVQPTIERGYIIAGYTYSFAASNNNTRLINTSVDKNNIPQNDHLVSDFSLQQNYPNPFNLLTTIKFELLKVSEVTFKIYDNLGEVVTLASDQLATGNCTSRWDAVGIASGIYRYRVTG